MGYDFSIGKAAAMRVKKQGDYPWPAPQAEPPLLDRTILLFTDDVLTKDPASGTYMKHTGLGCLGIVLADDEVEPWGEDKHLRLI